MREDGLLSLSQPRVGAVTGLLSVVPSVNLLNSAFRHRTSRHVPATYTEWHYTGFYSLTKMNDPVYEKEQAQFGGAIHKNVPQVGNQCLRACSSEVITPLLVGSQDRETRPWSQVLAGVPAGAGAQRVMSLARQIAGNQAALRSPRRVPVVQPWAQGSKRGQEVHSS